MNERIMKMKATCVTMLTCACVALIISGCGAGNDTSTGFGWLVGGCAGQDQALVEQQAGFDESCKADNLLPEEPDYCTEKLFWHYDAATGTLQMVNAYVSLNCCGIRYVRGEFTEGFHTFIEMDEPDGYRCRCMCDTIYSMCLHDLAPDLTPIRLLRHVTDETLQPETIWEGELDLNDGSGVIELGPSSSWHCEG